MVGVGWNFHQHCGGADGGWEKLDCHNVDKANSRRRRRETTDDKRKNRGGTENEEENYYYHDEVRTLGGVPVGSKTTNSCRQLKDENSEMIWSTKTTSSKRITQHEETDIYATDNVVLFVLSGLQTNELMTAATGTHSSSSRPVMLLLDVVGNTNTYGCSSNLLALKDIDMEYSTTTTSEILAYFGIGQKVVTAAPTTPTKLTATVVNIYGAVCDGTTTTTTTQQQASTSCISYTAAVADITSHSDSGGVVDISVAAHDAGYGSFGALIVWLLFAFVLWSTAMIASARQHLQLLAQTGREYVCRSGTPQVVGDDSSGKKWSTWWCLTGDSDKKATSDVVEDIREDIGDVELLWVDEQKEQTNGDATEYKGEHEICVCCEGGDELCVVCWTAAVDEKAICIDGIEGDEEEECQDGNVGELLLLEVANEETKVDICVGYLKRKTVMFANPLVTSRFEYSPVNYTDVDLQSVGLRGEIIADPIAIASDSTDNHDSASHVVSYSCRCVDKGIAESDEMAASFSRPESFLPIPSRRSYVETSEE
eukprot:GHVS01000263.1.p1 GENE.GHVS01000263.1~~GHVS01000263.1.p1  ORF type:complete len:539 (-),score=158.83 GHVS01000263.1:181-1797(-)